MTTNAPNPVAFFSGEFDGNPGTPARAASRSMSPASPSTPSAGSLRPERPGPLRGRDQGGRERHRQCGRRQQDGPALDGVVEVARRVRLLRGRDAEAAEPHRPTTPPRSSPTRCRRTSGSSSRTTRRPARSSLDHTRTRPIREMTFLKRRADGLALTGVAADDVAGQDAVPTSADVTLGLRGYATVDVNANTLDLYVQATQVGGFNNTAQFFEKYRLEYAALRVKNAPDLTANFDGVERAVHPAGDPRRARWRRSPRWCSTTTAGSARRTPR